MRLVKDNMRCDMKVILVDNDQIAVDIFAYESKEIEDLEIVGTFESGVDAYAYVQEHPVDLAVLDTQMGGMDGLALGVLLKRESPDLKIIYITSSDEYAKDAIRLNADGYLTKPYSRGELTFCIESARRKITKRARHIFAKTFGHFDLYVDGQPMMFRSGKAKELLALLIDREGGTVNSDQIIGILWEDRPNDENTQNLCSKIVKTLKKELSDYQIEDLLITNRGIRRINKNRMECDLYQLLEGDERAVGQYMGEYMVEYSWAESRMASLAKFLS